jgi:hypothetical protein
MVPVDPVIDTVAVPLVQIVSLEEIVPAFEVGLTVITAVPDVADEQAPLVTTAL